MRVPGEAGAGKAIVKVTVSFPHWKEANLVPATMEVPMTDAPAVEDKR